MKRISLLLPMLLLMFFCKGQEAEQKFSKADQLCALISKLFYAARSEQATFVNEMQTAPSEAIIILLQLDSIGSVNDIRLLADSRNRDSAFIILNNWKVTDFASWNDESYKGKTIMIPFVVLSRSEQPKYVTNLTSISVGLPKVARNLVTMRTVVASWPYTIAEQTTTPSIEVK